MTESEACRAFNSLRFGTVALEPLIFLLVFDFALLIFVLAFDCFS